MPSSMPQERAAPRADAPQICCGPPSTPDVRTKTTVTSHHTSPAFRIVETCLLHPKPRNLNLERAAPTDDESVAPRPGARFFKVNPVPTKTSNHAYERAFHLNWDAASFAAAARSRGSGRARGVRPGREGGGSAWLAVRLEAEVLGRGERKAVPPRTVRSCGGLGRGEARVRSDGRARARV